MEINQFLDATYLKTAIQANISEEENQQKVKTLLDEAIQFNYKLVMIRAKYIPFAKEYLGQYKSKTLLGTVIGFHEATYTLEEKISEAKTAIDLNTDELDFVVNYQAYKNNELQLVKDEIFKCTQLCLNNNKAVKWIIEIAALTNQEIINITKLIKEIVLQNFNKKHFENVFVKSSTGFYKTENNKPNGATFEAMKLISENAKPLKVKAAGGVKDYGTALKMISLGVDRIGTSSAKEICTKQENNNTLAY